MWGGGGATRPRPRPTPLLLQGNLCWIVAFAGDILVHLAHPSRVRQQSSRLVSPMRVYLGTQVASYDKGCGTQQTLQTNTYIPQLMDNLITRLVVRAKQTCHQPSSIILSCQHCMEPVSSKCKPLWYGRHCRGTPPTDRRAHCAFKIDPSVLAHCSNGGASPYGVGAFLINSADM